MKDKILELIPFIGVTLFMVAVFFLLLVIWGNDPLFYFKIVATSLIGVLFLKTLEEALQ